MTEEIYKSWAESAKKFISFSMMQETSAFAHFEDYFEQIGRMYSQIYQELISAYLEFPKALAMKNVNTMESISAKPRVIYSTSTKENPRPQLLMHFEDFAVGASFSSGETMVTRDDIQRFADLTGDRNRLHLDDEFAKSNGFDGVIDHGLLTLSIALGLWHSLDLTNGTILAFAGLSNVSFKAPVYPGDRLRLTAEVVAMRESKSKPKAGLVTLKMKVLDSPKGIVVLEAEPIFLISKREYALD
ncbi:MAG TPA: MaoC/PaaZ C-terminal domain-containing protein [Nitrososphaerales archaeon]|nr:MaoC/PaaZ C-terminal domain-containing protein [Nitrososphaerales archaeon]